MPKIDRNRLPDGVNVPTHLDEEDARALVQVFADTYGWTHLIIDRKAVESHLAANNHNTSKSSRELAPAEWQRVRATAAWSAMPRTTHQAITDGDTVTAAIRAAIRQAALECAHCDTPLTGPPPATWGYCPSCLLTTNLETLRRRHCPAASADAPHRWGHLTCRDCGLPRTDAVTSARRLAAVPAA